MSWALHKAKSRGDSDEVATAKGLDLLHTDLPYPRTFRSPSSRTGSNPGPYGNRFVIVATGIAILPAPAPR